MIRYDVGVIGLGVMGAATAFALSKRGASVVAADQFGLPNTEGSSHGRTRVIRQAYFEHPSYVPLLTEAYDLWFQLQQLSGRPIIELCGGLYFGHPDSPLIAGCREAALRHSLPLASPVIDDVQRAFPMFAFQPGQVCLLEPNAGFVYAETSVQAFVDAAVAAGASLHSYAEVSYEEAGNGFQMQIGGENVRVNKLVVTTGRWSREIIDHLELPLRVSRQVVAWYHAHAIESFSSKRFPVFAGYQANSLIYGIPVPGESTFGPIKIADHALGPTRTTHDSNEATVAERNRVAEIGHSTFPGSNLSLESVGICHYTNSPDGHFIIDRHPLKPSLAFAAGFSGHGFKFAPVIGEILADLALNQHTERDISLFSLNRFR